MDENDNVTFLNIAIKSKVVSKCMVKMVHCEVLTSPPAERVACPQETFIPSQSLSTDSLHASYSSNNCGRWLLSKIGIPGCSAISAMPLPRPC